MKHSQILVRQMIVARGGHRLRNVVNVLGNEASFSNTVSFVTLIIASVFLLASDSTSRRRQLGPLQECSFTGSQHCYQRWQRDWSRDQCVMVAQVLTDHSPLAAAYLHGIGCRDSAICPHCQGAEETVEHLVFLCSAHNRARRNMWPGDSFTTDPWHLWSCLERIGVVTPPPLGMRERELIVF